LVRASC